LPAGVWRRCTAENCRRQPWHGHVGNHDLGRLAHRLLEGVSAAVHQDRQMTETFDLLHQRRQFRRRDADQLDMQARRRGLAVLFGAGAADAPGGRTGGQNLGKRGHLLRANLQHGAPFSPAPDHSIDHVVECITADAEAGRSRQETGKEAPARFFIGHADLGQRAGEIQRVGQGLYSRAVPKAGDIRLFMMVSGLNQHVGQAPLGEHRGAELMVVHVEAFALECRQVVRRFLRLEQYVGVFVRVERGHGQFTNPRQQTDGEQFLARNLREVGEFLAGNAGGQRVSPERTVIKRCALTAGVAVHHREANHQITHPEGAKGNDGALQRDDRPRAAKGSGIGELEQAPGDGRVGLNQLHQIRDPEIIPLQELDDRKGNAFRRRQLAGCLHRVVAVGVDKVDQECLDSRICGRLCYKKDRHWRTPLLRCACRLRRPGGGDSQWWRFAR
jgi:hypothetical protein